MTVTLSVTLDSNLIFTYGGTRLADGDPLVLTAASGEDAAIHLNAPMTFTASHDERGKPIAWRSVATTDGSCTLTWTFPCPRSPFTLTVSTTAPATGATTSKTKKVRIEAGATGTAREKDVQAHGHEKPGQ